MTFILIEFWMYLLFRTPLIVVQCSLWKMILWRTELLLCAGYHEKAIFGFRYHDFTRSKCFLIFSIGISGKLISVSMRLMVFWSFIPSSFLKKIGYGMIVTQIINESTIFSAMNFLLHGLIACSTDSSFVIYFFYFDLFVCLILWFLFLPFNLFCLLFRVNWIGLNLIVFFSNAWHFLLYDHVLFHTLLFNDDVIIVIVF